MRVGGGLTGQHSRYCTIWRVLQVRRRAWAQPEVQEPAALVQQPEVQEPAALVQPEAPVRVSWVLVLAPAARHPAR